MIATIDNHDSRRRSVAKRSDIRNERPAIPRKAKRIMPSWVADRPFHPPIQAAVKVESRGLNSFSKHRTPGAAQSAQQTNPKLMKSKRHKVTDVCNLSAEPGHTVVNNQIHQIRGLSPSRNVEGVFFSGVEHLRVQQKIERRAHELWYAGGCCDGTALNDWLHAEREVLEQFIVAYTRRPSLPQSSRRRSSGGGKFNARPSGIINWDVR